VVDDGPGRSVIQGAVEVGSQAAAGKKANHDTRWTGATRPAILMAS
jgi:hypothetical protein